jgi:hypothetical protein
LSSASLKDKIENKWDDETILDKVQLFFNDKVKAGVHFTTDSDGLIHGYTVLFVAGKKVLPSAPVEFDWPLQPMPIPEAMKGKLN